MKGYKQNVDKRRRAQVEDINPGDRVVVKQEKYVLNPPWDSIHFEVTEVVGTKVFQNSA